MIDKKTRERCRRQAMKMGQSSPYLIADASAWVESLDSLEEALDALSAVLHISDDGGEARQLALDLLDSAK
jgi:hypothetical protein